MKILEKIIRKNKIEKIFVEESLPEEIKRLSNAEKKDAEVLITSENFEEIIYPQIIAKKHPNKIKAFIHSLINDEIMEKDIPVTYKIIGLKVKKLKIQYLLLTIALLLPFLKIIIPPDDLLRHLVSYKFEYDYSKVYVNSYLPPYNPHITFEWVVGKIHQLLTNINLPELLSVSIVQAILIALLFVGIKLNTKTDKETSIIFALAMALISTRLFLGRPSLLETTLFLIILGSKRKWTQILTSTVMGMSYWLFWIYLIPLSFIKRSVFIPMLLSFIFWFVITDFKYFEGIKQLLFSIESSDVSVGENSPLITNIFANPGVILLILISIIKLTETKNIRPNKNFLAAAWFSLSNQVRYIEIIAPLLLLNTKEKIIYGIERAVKLNPVVLAILGTSILIGSIPAYKTIIFDKKTAKVFTNEKILTSLEYSFPILFSNQNVKLTPPMEIRWTNPKVLNQIKMMRQEGKISCAVLKKYRYTMLVESYLKEKPKCLKLIKTYKKVRIWKVKF
ncbi:hypothetical protein [Persephonella sp.]|uniref:hypothetical protein n=1 Tax=Persephonella sp. TaxID=2060922 RepID=UPI0025DC6D73|nr:hypothetical protein [Persephonella sp.]